MKGKPMDPNRDELMAEVLDDMIADVKRSRCYFIDACESGLKVIQRHEALLEENQKSLTRAEAKLELLESIKGRG